MSCQHVSTRPRSASHSRTGYSLPDVSPGIAATLATLAAGAWIDAGEPVVLLGDSGTGKTHLLIGLGLAACEQGRRVRYATTAQLVNELAEAADNRQLSRVVGRYGRLDLLLLDLCRHRDYAEGQAVGSCQRGWRLAVARHSDRTGAWLDPGHA